MDAHSEAIIQALGAGGFGAVVGWFVYYINRHRKGDVQFSDLTTVLGTIGGAAVLGLFPAKSLLFGAYGIGLFAGFFGYYIILLGLVGKSQNFDADWFLDGRRKKPIDPFEIPGDVIVPMLPPPGVPNPQVYSPSIVINNPPAASVLVPTAQNPTAAKIIQSCKDTWPSKKDACNKFVIEVASKYGVTLTGLADDIVDQIKGGGWTQHGYDGIAAAQAAASGKLVIAGQKSGDHVPPANEGHVAVIIDGPLAHDEYPSGYWGSTDSALRDKGGLGTTINWAWNADSRDTVTYASRAV